MMMIYDLIVFFFLPLILMNTNLVEILNSSCDQPNDSNFDFLGSSRYYDDDKFIELLKLNKNNFVVLGMNCQSLRAKFDELLLLLEQYNDQSGCGIAVLCLQETWLPKGSEAVIDIPNYNYVLGGCSASSHGGVAIYVRKDLQFDILSVPDYSSNIWENLFIQVYGQITGGSKIVIGNVYRPPRDRVELLDKFLLEFNTIIESLESFNSVHIIGDYNLDVLKCQSNVRINRFIHESFASAYFPKILNPTRITQVSQTLIDNVFCKFSKSFHTIQAGILTHRFSDHQPYFISLVPPQLKRSDFKPPKFIHKTNMTEKAKLNFKGLLESELKLDKFDVSDDADAQINFDIFHDIMSTAHSSCFEEKRVRFDRRKVSKLPWVTPGLVKSIRTRNKLYKKLKSMDPKSEKYEILNFQLKHFGKVLKNSIKLAKRNYYSKLFEVQKNDPRKMWQTISSLTSNKTNQSQKLPDSFIIDGKAVSDPQTIADGFNDYFLNVASTNDTDSTDDSFKSYLADPVNHT